MLAHCRAHYEIFEILFRAVLTVLDNAVLFWGSSF